MIGTITYIHALKIRLVFFLKFGSRVSWRSGKITPCCYFCDINLPCILQLLQVVNCSDCSTLSDSLSRNGEYYRENQDLASNLKTKFDPHRNRWGKWLVSKKVIRKISFQTMVFARNLDKRQWRYRHSKTVDITLLTWTLVYWFSTVLRQKNVRNRKSLWASKFKFWTWRGSTTDLDVRSGKWSTMLMLRIHSFAPPKLLLLIF